jgi:hypothetical protein
VTKRKATEPAKESPKKKSRPSIADERKSTGGKSLPKKSLPVPSGGKVKSAEIIESESESEEEEDDDFAALLGAEMAKGDDEDDVEEPVQEVVDYEDSTSGEEDDDSEL